MFEFIDKMHDHEDFSFDILPNLKDWDSRIKRGKLQYEVLDPLS